MSPGHWERMISPTKEEKEKEIREGKEKTEEGRKGKDRKRRKEVFIHNSWIILRWSLLSFSDLWK